MQAIQTTTVYWLVAISVLISIVASYAAFNFAERVATSKGALFLFWLLSGAMAMGLGIWSMHYLGMLAVRLPVDVFYHVPTVLLSLLMAILASLVALLLVSRRQLSRIQIAVGGVLMGSGIGAMHYTGMHAMRSSVMHRYRPSLVLLSVAVAVVFSWMSLWIAFSMRPRAEQREWIRMGGATLMGLGIAAMHYTAMAAVSFMPANMMFSTENTIRIGTIGVISVVCTTSIVLLGALVTTLLDRRVYEGVALERDRWHAMAECSMDCLYLCEALRDARGEIVDFLITYVNSNAEKSSGIPRDSMIGGKLCEQLPTVRKLGHFELYKQVVLTGEPLAIEFSLEDADRKVAWVRIQAVKVRDGVAITASDITARKRNEEQILYLAHHDPLTGLMNRSLLTDRITQAINRSNRNCSYTGIFLIDVDCFKEVNDTLGHATGDAALVVIANRLQRAVRVVDSVVRLGGDEFVVVMPEIRQRFDVENCAKRILRAFEPRIAANGHSLVLHCSIGVAVYPESAQTCEELLSKADAAMYLAKRRGKNQFEIHAPRAGSQQTSEDWLTAEPVPLSE